MRFVRIVIHRWRSLLRSSRGEREMRDELGLHLEHLTREYMAAGMSETEARRAARRDFGPIEPIKEQCRDARRIGLAQDTAKDVAYAGRLLIKSPGFTLAAILSLALGIGANAAIFSLVDAVLLRTMPSVHEPTRLVEVSRDGGRALSYAVFEAIRDRTSVFSGVLLTSGGRFAASLDVSGRSGGEVHLSPVSAEYFTVLGVTPVLGRALDARDMAPSNTAVISHALWERVFNGDPNVLGTQMRVGRRDYTVVGVAPRAFSGVLTGHRIDLWVPITWFDDHYLRNSGANMFRTIARVRAGVSRDQVRANVDVIAAQITNQWHLEKSLRLDVGDASGGLTVVRRQFSGALWILMGVVALLLLIATVNVANLLLARAGARRREMAVRLSIGASRWRLLRQLLTESAVLGAIAGAIGVALAPTAAASLVRFLSAAMGTMELSTDINPRVLMFTVVVLLIAVVLFGLAPALAATRLDLTSLMKGGPAGDGGRGTRARLDRVLVAVQVAISCVLLAGALLFSRSLLTLMHVDAGFRPEHVVLLSVGLDPARSRTPVDRVRAYDRVVDRLSHVPGVESVGYSSERLFGGGTWTEPIVTPRFNPAPGQDRDAVLLVVSPGFFEALGTRLVRGRPFDVHDDERSEAVAVINEAAARYFFARTDAVGDILQIGDGDVRRLRVAGVVQDAKYRTLREPAPRMVYLPALQMPDAAAAPNLAIRTTAEPDTIADALWNEARREVPDLRWRGATTQRKLIDGTIAPDRMLAQLSGVVGATALLLVCVGLYGLTAYEASRRRREIGVRLALGAQRAHIVRNIVGRSLLLVTAGLVAGVGGAAAFARALEGVLFGVKSSDLVTLAGAPVVLLTIAALAAYLPARRAARLNPIVTLRAD